MFPWQEFNRFRRRRCSWFCSARSPTDAPPPVSSAGKKKMSLYDSQAPICPICQVLLRPGELQEHMETEIERLTSMCLRYRHSHARAHDEPNCVSVRLLDVGVWFPSAPKMTGKPLRVQQSVFNWRVSLSAHGALRAAGPPAVNPPPPPPAGSGVPPTSWLPAGAGESNW